ncbi:hypothetical protein OAD25_01590 [Gammaproteobacteria bacterium]|jgi:hypothetical protein|nr:hypothetical protein [Gammaproteobacteria bacterium]
MKYFKYLFLISFLYSCATNSGVVPIGNEQFFISKQAATGFTGLGNLKAEAIKEGTVFCSAMKKEFELISQDQSEGLQVLGNFPRVEITFICK